MSLDILKYRINKELIAWCIQYNKTIADISVYDKSTGKLNTLYSLICVIRLNKSLLDEETIALLNKYGMTWGRSEKDYNTIVKNQIIPWCKENNLQICDISVARREKLSSTKEILALLKKIRKNRAKLTEESITLLNQYGMVWEEATIELNEQQLKELKQRIDFELIQWCKTNNKKLYNIPAFVDTKHNPLYTLISYLRDIKTSLPDDIINLLNQYSMPWLEKSKEYDKLRKIEKVVDDAKTILIPWCTQNNKKIYEAETGTKEYYIVQKLRSFETDLDEETITLLTKHGMLWKKDLINGRVYNHDVLEARIKTELIPYLDENHFTIPEVPSHDKNGKVHQMYRIIIVARRAGVGLKPDIIDLLNKYKMNWEKKSKLVNKATGAIRTNPNERVKKELIPWCKQNNTTIDKIPQTLNGKTNPLYTFISLLRRRRAKGKLTKETIALLDKYGMIWNTLVYRGTISYIKETLIPWCTQNNKKIYDIPSTINGKANPLYAFVCRLRGKKDKLDIATIALLDEYGMIWESGLILKMAREKSRQVSKPPKVKDDKPKISPKIKVIKPKKSQKIIELQKQVRQSLIPWCIRNQKDITHIYPNINRTCSKLYSLLKELRLNKNELDKKIITLLNNYGMVWEENVNITQPTAKTEPTTLHNSQQTTSTNQDTTQPKPIIKQMIENGRQSAQSSQSVKQTEQTVKLSYYTEQKQVETPVKTTTRFSNAGNIEVEVTYNPISKKRLRADRYITTEDWNIYEVKIKLTACVDRVVAWMDKHLKYIHHINPDKPCYEDLQFILENAHLLVDEQLKELELYGFSAGNSNHI